MRLSERLRFVRDARRRLVTFTELCAIHGIRRVTGYKWLERSNASGLAFLPELSRRPHSCPHATPPDLSARLLEAGRHHPAWGARKLLALMRRQDCRRGVNCAWPARSIGLGNSRYCFPLTVQDGCSRYLLGCRGLRGTATEECRPVFQRLFQGTPCRRFFARITACPSHPGPGPPCQRSPRRWRSWD